MAITVKGKVSGNQTTRGNIGKAETVAWHEDDETVPCRFYSRDDALLIIGTLTTYKEYHITYFRDLRIYVNSLSSVAEINAVQYGFTLPEEAKSDVLKTYEQQLGIAA